MELLEPGAVFRDRRVACMPLSWLWRPSLSCTRGRAAVPGALRHLSLRGAFPLAAEATERKGLRRLAHGPRSCPGAASLRGFLCHPDTWGDLRLGFHSPHLCTPAMFKFQVRARSRQGGSGCPARFSGRWVPPRPGQTCERRRLQRSARPGSGLAEGSVRRPRLCRAPAGRGESPKLPRRFCDINACF